MAHWRSFAIVAWQSRADGPSAKEAVRFADQLIGKTQKFSVIHVVEGTAGLPTPEGRNEFVAITKRHNDYVACVGVLMPESQVVASMLRVFVRGIHTLNPGALETIVEREVSVLARKVAQTHERRAAQRFDPIELESAIDAVRRLQPADQVRAS